MCYASFLEGHPLGSLSEERLLEWRGVVQDLMEAKFNLSFLLEYLRLVAQAFFQRVTKDLDIEIATVEEALARAHKVLQDLKTRKPQSSPLWLLLLLLQFLKKALCWLDSCLSFFF